MQGGWLCSLLFEITAPLGDATLSPRFAELELRICPTSLLQATQRAALPTIFEDAITGIASQHLNLLQILRRVADDGSRSFRGWLWFFSLPQCDFIESIGPVPWDTVVNPLWDQIIAAVEASRTAFKLRPSPLPDPALGPPSLEPQLLEGCVGVAPSLACPHDGVDVLPRRASSPSGAAPVLVPRPPVPSNFEQQYFQFGPSHAASFYSTPPATSPIGANPNFLSQSHPIHFEADDDDWKSFSDSSIDGHQSLWTAQLCYSGHAEDTFCQNQRLLPDVLDTTWSAPSLVDLIENIGLALRIHYLARSYRNGPSI